MDILSTFGGWDVTITGVGFVPFSRMLAMQGSDFNILESTTSLADVHDAGVGGSNLTSLLLCPSNLVQDFCSPELP
jgi:hypothetical protein